MAVRCASGEFLIQRAQAWLSISQVAVVLMAVALARRLAYRPRIRKIVRATANWPFLRASRDWFLQSVRSEARRAHPLRKVCRGSCRGDQRGWLLESCRFR